MGAAPRARGGGVTTPGPLAIMRHCGDPLELPRAAGLVDERDEVAVVVGVGERRVIVANLTAVSSEHIFDGR